MPAKCAALLKIIGFDRTPTMADARAVRGMPSGAKVQKPEPLFPRVEFPKP
jgi:hypothetical protein